MSQLTITKYRVWSTISPDPSNSTWYVIANDLFIRDARALRRILQRQGHGVRVEPESD